VHDRDRVDERRGRARRRAPVDVLAPGVLARGRDRVAGIHRGAVEPAAAGDVVDRGVPRHGDGVVAGPRVDDVAIAVPGDHVVAGAGVDVLHHGVVVLAGGAVIG